MRIRVLILAAALVAALCPAAHAQDARQAAPDSPPPQTRAARLDALFDSLKTAKSDTAAEAAENGILSVWLQSGSDTVDLMMTWALKAMEAKDYSAALDFLGRITQIRPDFVEGWNKRATVYYLTDDYARSLSDIRHVLALEPRHFGALAGLGSILRELGEDREALVAYRAALAADPHMDEVRKAIDELEKKGVGGREI
jgi:tetratricopeptide (TPR) repeat protein